MRVPPGDPLVQTLDGHVVELRAVALVSQDISSPYPLSAWGRRMDNQVGSGEWRIDGLMELDSSTQQAWLLKVVMIR